MSDIVSAIRTTLLANVDQNTKETGDRYFKEPVLLYGVKTSIVSDIADEYFEKISGLRKYEIFALCEELLQSDYCEDAWIAFDWSDRIHKQYMPQDFERFEDWIEKYVNNWAKCDTLCNHTVGTFLEMYPHYLSELKKWARSNNRWLRRAAAVSLVLPARKGKFLTDVFAIADILLADDDDLVQKGYGWMLKEASKSHRQAVYDYIMKHKHNMPRTALRYAIEKMPDQMRESAMA